MQRLEQITIKKINQFYLVHSYQGRQYAVKNRKDYGLAFCTEGTITYHHNGKQFISYPGDAVFLPQGSDYHLHGDSKGDFGVINFTITDDVRIEDFLVIPTHDPSRYMRDYFRMQELSLFPHKRLQVMKMMYEILERLSGEMREKTHLLTPILQYLEDHYTDWSLTSCILAEQAHISEVYLRQLFRQELGISPKQYILSLRLNKARQMLCEEDTSVTDIAHRCGFSSIYHFCRVFRQATGRSPTEYRRAYWSEML